MHTRLTCGASKTAFNLDYSQPLRYTLSLFLDSIFNFYNFMLNINLLARRKSFSLGLSKLSFHQTFNLFLSFFS